jgi:predicted membrane channel-forming protein YqfA (hemolysin III family)
MWTTAELVAFQKYLFSVTLPIVIVIGNVGSILNIIVFSVSKKLRSSPCSLYLTFASIGYAVYLNVVALLRFLQVSFSIDPSSQWLWFCKLRFYAVGVLLMLPRSYMLLAAIDR